MTEALKDTPKNMLEEKKKDSLYYSVYSYTCNNTKLDRESIKNLIESIPQNNQPCRLLGGDTQTQSEKLKKSFECSLQYTDSQIKEFEDLEKALPEGIVKKIKASGRYKPILIIGGKEGLVNGVVSHLWYTHPIVPQSNSINEDLIIKGLNGYIGRINFKEVNYTGKTKEYIEKDIDSILKHYLTGGMLFLRGIRSDSSGIFKHLASMTSNPGSGEIKGVLIISTDNLPQGFKDQFEPIYLEQEKQDTPQSKKRNKLFYSYNKQDKLTLFFKKDESITLTNTEAKLFLFLKEDRKTPEEIIEHVWEVYKPKDMAKKKAKGNVKELRNRINNKCCRIGVGNLISELTEGCYSLTVEAVEQ